MKRDEFSAGGSVRDRQGAVSGKKVPSASLTLALEPRFMYDAAGGATAAAVAKAAEPAPLPPADHAADTAAKGAAASPLADQAHAAETSAPTPGDGSKHTDIPADVGPFGSKGEAQLEKAAVGDNAPIREIVFVDGRLPDLGDFKAQPGVEIVVLDPSKDGLGQVSDVLAAHKGDLTAIHFVGHGESGQFGIGSTTIDAATLSAKAGEIAQWGSALAANGDIMIWGCDVAQLPGGEALIQSLSSLTGADVAASTDDTGASALGGNWTLEATTGSIETAMPFEAAALAAWDHVLDTPTVTGTADVLRVSEPSSLNAAGADIGSLSGWNFTSSNTGDQFFVSATVGDTSVGTILNGSGLGSAAPGGWTYTGTLAEVNAWLDSLSFKAADVERGTASGNTSLILQITNQTDASHPTSQRSIAVEVTPSNDPTAVDDKTVSVLEGGTSNLRPDAADRSQDWLIPADSEVAMGSQVASQIVYKLLENPQYGYLTLNGVRLGVNSIFTQQDVLDGKLVYHHAPGSPADQNTQDAFRIQVNDGATPLAQSDTARITINITPENQAPTVSGGAVVYEGQPANAQGSGAADATIGSNVGLAIQATDGGDPGDSLSVRITALAQYGKLYFTGTATVNGVTQVFSNHEITAAEISTGTGFIFAYADRGGLTYVNDGVDNTGAGDPNPQRPEDDSFGVEVLDAGGGAVNGMGQPDIKTASTTIAIDVLPVNDDPVWQNGSLDATVAPDYEVTLTKPMLNVSDVDSPDSDITFALKDWTGLDHGRLYLTNGTPGDTGTLIQPGQTFTLADIEAGRVVYRQLAGADPAGDLADTFNFTVVDKAMSLRWNADGTGFSRIGGIYEGAELKNFTFTVHLLPTDPGGPGPALPDPIIDQPAAPDQSHAGTDTGGSEKGLLDEGGTIRVWGSANAPDGDGTVGNSPFIHYAAPGVPDNEIVYTIMGLNGVDGAWNGQVQKYKGTGDVNDSANWETMGVYDTFTQADLNAGYIRFQHDGGESFHSQMLLSVSSGLLVRDGGGNVVVDEQAVTFDFWVTPVNDAPVNTGSSQNVISEGQTVLITTGMLQVSDPDDADSQSYLENPTGAFDPNFAQNHDAANPLLLQLTDAPDGGELQYFDGTDWILINQGDTFDSALIAAGRLRYVHSGGEGASDAFKVQAIDRTGQSAATEATVGFVITPVNDPPQIGQLPTTGDSAPGDPVGPAPGTDSPPVSGVNNPLNIVFEGAYHQITSDDLDPAGNLLQAVDPDSSADQVQYRITGAPEHGRIAIRNADGSFSTLGAGSSFSQAQLDAGLIYYLHDGTDPSGNTYPSTPDDKFTFTLADGANEQTGNEFWIYVKPTNDQPVVTAPTGPIDNSTGSAGTSVPGFQVSDPDLVDQASYETDYVEVVVRLLDANGDPLHQADGNAATSGDYDGVTISVDAAFAALVGDHNGTNDFLVLRGTIQQINDALASLKVAFDPSATAATDQDSTYQVQVIVDDRLRDASGNLVDVDSTAGTQYGGNGGGTQNQPEVPLVGSSTDPEGLPQTVLGTELDWYTADVPNFDLPTTDPLYALAGNMNQAKVTIRVSQVNDPVEFHADPATPVTVNEDQPTFIGQQVNLTVADAESEAFGTPVTVTLSVPSGTLDVGTWSGVQVTGDGTGTLTLTGVTSAIEAFLKDTTQGLKYLGAADVNHDLNSGADGDVTLTISYSDAGSTVGQPGEVVTPIQVGITIVPVNDRPTVSAGTGTIPLTGSTSVDGFQVTDKDISGDNGGIAAGENDFLEVTVRLTDTSGNPLNLASYDGTNGIINITSSASVPGLVIDGTYNGTGSALVLRGTQAQINAYLAGLQVEIGGALTNTDTHYRVEVIADDRMRDGSGAFVGTEANGGENDDGAGGTSDVPTAEFDVYGDDTAEILALGLTPDVNFASRDVFPTSVNDPAHVDVPAQQQDEGGSTYQFHDINITDADALSDDLDITVTLDPGFTFAASSGVTEGSTTATFSGSLSEINTWVNSLKVNLPSAGGLATDWNGSFGVQIVVNDNGNNGGRPSSLPGDTDDPTTDHGDFEYADGAGGSSNVLVTTRDFTVTINPVNDAPMVDTSGGSEETLPAINEGTAAADIDGATVSDLFSDYFLDGTDQISGGSSQDAFLGVVVVGLDTNPNQGVWQYSTDGGLNWTAIGPRTDATGLYLGAGDLVRFVPAHDFHGTPEKLTVRLVENNVGGGNDPMSGSATPPAGGATVDVSGASHGGTTRYSAGTVTLATSVTPVNDRPTVDPGAMTAIDEDSTPAGQTVGALFGGSYSDATDDQSAPAIGGGDTSSSSLGGIAITGNSATSDQGTWQYFDGIVWQNIPTAGLSDSNALVLSTSTLIRFLPAGDYNGTPGSLNVRATDQTVSSNGVQNIAADVANGESSHWSAQTTLGIVVNPVNDAPVIDGVTQDGITVNVTENSGLGTGTSSVTLISGSSLVDVDPSTTPGLDSTVFGAGQIEITLDTYVTGDLIEVTGLPAGVTVDTTDNGVGRKLVIHLDSDTTIAQVRGILDSITFRNSSDNPTNFGVNDTRIYTVAVLDGVNTDPQGDTAGTGGSLVSNQLTGTIKILAVNDPPVAEDNTNSVTEDGALATGNVITDGTPVDSDPDTPVPQLIITEISNGTDTVTPTGGEMVIDGKYGTLTIHADGSYSYALDSNNPVVNALKDGETLNDEVFTYTLSDQSTGTDTATLTITINGHTDGAPGIAAVDGNGAATGENTVNEAGLPIGSDPSATSETVNGSITVTAADGLANVIISDGVDAPVTLDLADLAGLSPSTPVTIVTAKGTLVLTGFTSGISVGSVPTSGTLTYTYTLTADQDHSGGAVTDVFDLTVTDGGGDTDTGNLTILIQDDGPTARADVNSVTEDAADNTASGNVFGSGSAGDIADTIGADGAGIAGPVTGVSFGATVGTVGSPLTTAYGSIVINADGSYTYTLNNGNPTVNALQTGGTLSEVVSYTITDADGDTSVTTLTITIHGNTDGSGPSITPADENGGATTGQNTVSEAGLPTGTAAAGNSESADGTIDVAAPDGLTSVVIGGTTVSLTDLQNLGTTPRVITTPDGAITLTGFDVIASVGGVPTHGTLSYTYTLAADQDHSAGTPVTDVLSLQVNDAGGGSATGNLTILIQDDAPIARNDTNALTEGTASVDGNVFGASGASAGDVADTIGADGQGASGAVTSVAFGATTGTVGASITTTYGSIVVNADGTYTYTLDNSNAAVNALKSDDSLTEVVHYTITDADGDTSTATLTITINGDTDGTPTVAPDDLNGAVTGENTVYESGLTDTSGDQITTGTIQVSAPDGLSSVSVGGVEVPLGDLANLGTTPVVITTPAGTITLTGFTPGTSVGGVPTAGELTYTYELTAPQNQPGATESTDVIALVVTDAGGDTSNGTLTITIVDHVPQAQDDAASITEDAMPGSVSGNLVTSNDNSGADGYPGTGGLTNVSFGGTPQTVGTSFGTTYGSIVVNADGSYTYTLDNANPAVTALQSGQTLTEQVTYTITDSDGDISTATLTITINGTNDAPVVTPGDHVVGREDQTLTFDAADFAFTDAEGDAPTAIRITTLPPHGTLFLDGVAVSAGTTVSIADITAGKLTYRPAPDGNGDNYTNFTFQVSDGNSFSNPGNMRIDIVPVNDTPAAAGPDQATANEDTLLAFDGGSGENHAPVLTIDDIADRLGAGYTDAFTITLSVQHGTLGISDPTGSVTGEGSGATLTLTGTRQALNQALATLTYLAEHNYAGTDQLTLLVDDHTNAGTGPDAEPPTATHLTDILVNPIADAPTLVTPPAQGVEDHWVPLDITVGPTDLSNVETVSLDLSGLPEGWQIRVGDGEPRTSTGGGEVFHFTPDDLAAGIFVLPPPNINTASGQSIMLDVVAISQDGPVSRAFTPGQIELTLAPENDQPVATGSVALPPVDNRPANKPGTTLSDLLGGNYVDPTDHVSVSHGTEGNTPLAGVAIVGNAATSDQGAWQYNLNDGTGWHNVPTSGLGVDNALVLPASAQIRFTPTTGYSGSPGTLSVHLSDGVGFPGGGFVDLTQVAAGAPGTQIGGWSRNAVPIGTSVVNAPGVNEAAEIDTPGYDRWGVMAGATPYGVRPVDDGGFPYLEGWPVHRYTTTWQGISQQVMFRYSGEMNTSNLFYEAMLGRNQALPSWISFDPYTQTVMALPPDDVQPGVYMVRVVARDALGHEAESTVTIHVLRDNARSFESAHVRVQQPEEAPPAEDQAAPPQDDGQQPREQAPAPAPEAAPPAGQGEQNGARSQKTGSDSAAILPGTPVVPGVDAQDLSADSGISGLYFGHRPQNSSLETQKNGANGAGEGVVNSSLTKTLLNSGTTGRMIEAAQFLEALAADARPHL